MKKYKYTYLIYCTEPKSNYYGCIYYGQHSTNNICDKYITSGKLIFKYIKKYPNGYYRKILHFYNTQEELNNAEYKLIHNHLGKPYCLNLCEGGNVLSMPGHLNPMYGKNAEDYMTPEAIKKKRQKQGESLRKTLSLKTPEQRKTSELVKKHMRENHADVSGEKNPMYGKKLKDYMTEEAYNEMKRKQKENHAHTPCSEKHKQYLKEKYKGSGNPVFGYRYMNNKKDIQVYAKPSNFQYYLDKGYIFGTLKSYLKTLEKE